MGDSPGDLHSERSMSEIPTSCVPLSGGDDVGPSQSPCYSLFYRAGPQAQGKSAETTGLGRQSVPSTVTPGLAKPSRDWRSTGDSQLLFYLPQFSSLGWA